MPAMRDIERSVKLEENGSFVGLFDPTKDVGMSETEQGWARYKFRFLDGNGRIVTLSGGVRLFDAIDEKVKGETPVKLKITARGKAGTTDRKFDVEIVR